MKIIENNKTEYMIVYNKDAHECVRYASNLLQEYLYLATSVCIPLFSDKCDRRGKEIILGEARGIDIRCDIEGLNEEAFVIKEVEGNLCFAANSPRGILYSVIRFLEDYIGYRCFSNDIEKYDKKDLIDFNGEIKYDFPFEYREVYFHDAFKSKFASMNMINGNLADLSDKLGGKLRWFNFHHSFSDICNPNEYFDTHPEYFSYIDGARRKEHTELCLSNEDVLNMAIKRVLEWKEKNPECKVFSVSQDEWMGHFIKMACECEECKKIDDYGESQSASIINFVNKVATEVKKVYPDILIHTFAYQYSRKPPKHFVPVDNVIVRLCNIECSWSKPIVEANSGESKAFYEDLINWSKITNRLYIWDYAVNFRNYLLPFPNLRSMVKNIEMYKNLKVKGLLMQGNFSNGGKGYLDEMKAYIASRFMRYDNLNLDEEIKEFCKYYYGKYASVAYKYIMLFEDEIPKYDLWLYDDSDHALFSDEILDKAKSILKEASNIDDKVYFNHFELLKMSFDYAYITRLPLDYKGRDSLVDEFFNKVHKHHITELFERTSLDFSYGVIKNSRYAKERDNWFSLYYIMK